MLPENESDALILKERELADKSGIVFSQVHGPWRWPPNDLTGENRCERMEKMKKSIHAIAILGCKNWVIHPILPYGIPNVNTDNALKTWECNLDFFSMLLKYAKEYDVTICLENMPFNEFSLATPETVLNFVKEINDEHFKICLDTGHVAVFENISLSESVRLLREEIRVLHVHDNKFGMDLHMMPFSGVIDWEAFGRALKDISFNG